MAELRENKPVEGNNYNYEVRMFGKLPHDLRTQVKKMDNSKADINLIDPFALVCIEITDNPGAVPFLIEPGKTSFDFLQSRAANRGVNLEEISAKLARKFP